MAVRIREEHRRDGVARPGRAGGERDEAYQAGKDPDVGGGRDDGSLLEAARDPGDKEQVAGEEDLRRNDEEVGMEDGEAELS